MRKRQKNYLKGIGVTLKHGKQLCIELNGRLPKVGRIMTVCYLYIQESENTFTRKLLEIQNISGSYELCSYRSVNWMGEYFTKNQLPKDVIVLDRSRLDYDEEWRINHGI